MTKCFCEADMVPINQKEIIEIRGEQIEVEFRYMECPQCGRKFEIQDQNYDPLAEAYRIYREKKGLLQPEQITQFREKLQLSQRDMSALLGIGVATLNRYENGALQNESVDKTIRYYMDDPENIRKRLNSLPDLLKPDVRDQLLRQLQEGNTNLVYPDYNEVFPLTLYNGFRSFDINRLTEMVAYICDKCENVTRTKLMKLLYYADFSHFRDNGISISGAYYAHVPYGPAVNDFLYHLAYLTRPNGEIKIEERLSGKFSYELLKTKSIDYTYLSISELNTLDRVIQKLGDLTAKKLSDLSHEEKGYKETIDGELILYSYAQDLKAI